MNFSILLLSSFANADSADGAWNSNLRGERRFQTHNQTPHIPATKHKFTLHAGSNVTEIQHDGADYIKVHFKRTDVELPEEDFYLTVSSADSQQSRETYHITLGDKSQTTRGEDDDGESSFYAMSVDSSKVTVALYNRDGVPQEIRKFVNIDHYLVGGEGTTSYSESDLGRKLVDHGRIDREDVACKEGDPDFVEHVRHSKPVARIVTFAPQAPGREFPVCTAWRVAGKETFMLTNYHCHLNERNYKRWEVQFNYKNLKCRGKGNTDFVTTATDVVKLPVHEVKKCNKRLDYCLFTLNRAEKNKTKQFGSLSLELGDKLEPGDYIYVPHHSKLHGLQLTIEADELRNRKNPGLCAVKDYMPLSPTSWMQIPEQDNPLIPAAPKRRNPFNFWRWPIQRTRAPAVDMLRFLCDLQRGSSGSPVISSSSHKVVALFNTYDYINRFFGGIQIRQIWTEIKDYGVSAEGNIPEASPADTEESQETISTTTKPTTLANASSGLQDKTGQDLNECANRTARGGNWVSCTWLKNRGWCSRKMDCCPVTCAREGDATTTTTKTAATSSKCEDFKCYFWARIQKVCYNPAVQRQCPLCCAGK